MNDKVKITCEICEDLLPLVEDHVASEESRNAVFSHISSCGECQKKYPFLAGVNAKTNETAGVNNESAEAGRTNTQNKPTKSEGNNTKDKSTKARKTIEGNNAAITRRNGENSEITTIWENREQDIIVRNWEYGEKDDSRILAAIRDKISIGLLLCISISLLLGVLIVVSSSSSPWLMLIIFPLICGFVYWTGGRAWRWVPPVAALFWIIITLLMHRNYVANWKAAILDSVVSAVFPLILCYVGALAAALLKYAFKGELQ